MIRKYDFNDCIKNTPRIIISMDIYGDGFETGFNEHYSLDSNLTECCEDFFSSMRIECSESGPVIGRSILEIEYADLPKVKGI